MKTTDRKTEISMHDGSFDKRNDSVVVEEVEGNEPGRGLIILDQVLNEDIRKDIRYSFFFGDVICKGINIKNLNSRL